MSNKYVYKSLITVLILLKIINYKICNQKTFFKSIIFSFAKKKFTFSLYFETFEFSFNLILYNAYNF